MWLGHDLAWWSFLLAIIGLILMFPTGIAVNIVTPKLQNWWAERSQSALKKRIDTIEQQLKDYESKYMLISDVEELGLVALMVVLFGLAELTMFANLILLSIHMSIRMLEKAPSTTATTTTTAYPLIY